MKKLLLPVLLCAAAFAVSAADWVEIDFNFYNPDGVITVESKLPDGVTFGQKIRFHNPKLKGNAFPIRVDLEKVQAVDLKLKVKGEGKIIPSVCGIPVPKRAGWEIECLEFEFCGEASDKTPFVFKKWTSMGGNPPLVAEDGETLTVKAKFKPVK